VNRSGLVLTALLILLAGGAIVVSGAYLPFVGGPGYQPTATDAPATGTAEGTDTTVDATPAPSPTAGRYDHATVTVLDGNGTELGTVRVAVADTPEKRYTGLSKTESLGIDIVYVGSNGTINSIHHAPEPPEGEDGEDYRYPGEGQYVLEVNYEWTTRHGIEPGDRVVIEGLDEG
jgi:hypothetical protein